VTVADARASDVVDEIDLRDEPPRHGHSLERACASLIAQSWIHSLRGEPANPS
jgi:hypothetical protein